MNRFFPYCFVARFPVTIVVTSIIEAYGEQFRRMDSDRLRLGSFNGVPVSDDMNEV